MDISSLRRSYALQSLDESEVSHNPFAQFKQWFEEAVSAQVSEPNAMTLATSTLEGRPSARIVLLKGYDETGFVFFTNYESRKGTEMAENPMAALLFCWLDLERQIRIEGRIQKISREASEQYFVSRPKSSQIGAWTSPQSTVIDNRNLLEIRQKALEEQYSQVELLPLPPNWGGYILVPDYFEFWQGRESRLHDRMMYQLEDSIWHLARLAP
jgi:pyridoxamine 5'-phosphate oxidase